VEKVVRVALLRAKGAISPNDVKPARGKPGAKAWVSARVSFFCAKQRLAPGTTDDQSRCRHPDTDACRFGDGLYLSHHVVRASQANRYRMTYGDVANQAE